MHWKRPGHSAAASPLTTVLRPNANVSASPTASMAATAVATFSSWYEAASAIGTVP